MLSWRIRRPRIACARLLRTALAVRRFLASQADRAPTLWYLAHVEGPGVNAEGLFLPGTPLLAVLNLWFWGLSAFWFMTRATFVGELFPGWTYYLALAAWGLGNLSVIYIGLLTLRVVGRPEFLLSALLVPLYREKGTAPGLLDAVRLFLGEEAYLREPEPPACDACGEPTRDGAAAEKFLREMTILNSGTGHMAIEGHSPAPAPAPVSACPSATGCCSPRRPSTPKAASTAGRSRSSSRTMHPIPTPPSARPTT